MEPDEPMQSMSEHRFKIFRRWVAVRACPGGWQAFYLGTDGKRRPADFIVPGDVAEDELAEYLPALFHEDATPGHDSVLRLP